MSILLKKTLVVKHPIIQMQHLPFSPQVDFFFLFPLQKIYLKGKKLKNIEDIRKITAQSYTISKEEFQRCFDQLKT